MPLIAKFKSSSGSNIIRHETAELVPSETPAGTINGLNTVFTLASTPVDSTLVQVHLNGLRQAPTTDFTVVGSTITFVIAPLALSILRVDYWRLLA